MRQLRLVQLVEISQLSVSREEEAFLPRSLCSRGCTPGTDCLALVVWRSMQCCHDATVSSKNEAHLKSTLAALKGVLTWAPRQRHARASTDTHVRREHNNNDHSHTNNNNNSLRPRHHDLLISRLT